MRKILPDQKSVQSSEAPTSLDSHPQGHDDATPSEALVNRAPDAVQAAPPPATEGKAGQTVGMAPVDHPAAEAAQVTPPPMIEHEGAPITRSLDGLSIVVAMAVVALGLIQFLFRPTYTKRILAFGAMRRSRPEDVRPVDLCWQPLNQIETDSSTASGLTSVKKVLDTIKEVEAEMAFSSPGCRHEADPSEGDGGLANELEGDGRLDARAAG